MKKTIVTLIFILIITFSLSVFAKERVDLNVDKSNIETGEEITVSINFSKEEQVAYAYTAKLSYDEDVFETIEEESFEEQENWSDINYNSKNKKFALINKSGESGKKLVQLKLKVKDNAKQGKTTISIGNVTSTDGKDDISIDGNSVEVQVGDVTENSTPDEIKNTSNETISVEAENQPSKFLATILIIIMAILATSLVYIITSKNINKNKKAVISIIPGIALLILLIITINTLKTEKGDINKDGTINYDDADKIIDYLLEIENPDEKAEDEKTEEESDDTNLAQSELDTNSDGRVSTADIGKVVKSAKSRADNGNNIASSQNNGTTGSNGSSSNPSNGGSQSGNQGGNTGTTPGGSQGENPSETPGENPSETPGENPGETPGGNPSENPGDNPGDNPGGNPSGGQGDNPGQVNPPKPNDKYSSHIGKGKNEYNQTPKRGEELTVDLQIKITPFEEIKSVIIDGKEVPVQYIEDDIYRVKVSTPQSAGVHDIKITGIVLKNGKTLDSKYEFTVDVLKTMPEVKSVNIDDKKQPPEISVDVKDDENAITGGKIIIKDKSGKTVFEQELTKENLKESFKLDKLERETEYEVTVETYYDLDSNKFGDIAQNSGTINYKQTVKLKADYGFNGINWKITPEVTEHDALIITFENAYNSYYDVKEIVIAGKPCPVIKKGNTYEVEIEKSQTKGQNTVKVEKVTLKNGESFEVNKELTYIYLKNKPTIGELTSAFKESNLNLTFDIQDNDKAIKKIKVYLMNEQGSVIAEKEIETGKNSVDFNVAGNEHYKIKVEYTYDLGKGEITEEKSYEHIKLKKAPTAKVESNVTREPTEEGIKSIKASIEIIDEDKAIKEGTLIAILKDPGGNLVDKISLNGTEKEIEFTSNEVYKAGTYTIEIQASYEVEDGMTHENETIGTGVVASLIYATIEKVDSKYYVEKGENFDITYTIKSNTQEEPSSVVINGSTYTLVKNSDGTYKVTIEAPKNAGIVDYSTERIVYANEQISSTKTTTIDVLKDTIPTVSALSFDTKTTQKPLLTFNITDPENTFISGKVKLTEEGKEPIELTMNSIEDTSFELTQIEENKEYKVDVEITYDLDSNKGQNVEDNRKTETLATGNIQWIKDYQFSLSDYKLDHIDTENKKIYVTFSSTNASNKYIVKTVDINGVDYDAKPNGGNSYIVEIPYDEPTQRQELILNEAILDNLQGFKADVDFNVDKITVFKTKPKAVAQANVSEDNKTITVQVAITDDEQIITSKKLKLTKEDGTYTETKDIDSNEITFNNDEKFKAGKYTIEVLSTFDSMDGNDHVDEVIGNTEAIVSPEINVKSEKATEYYVERNSNVTITYEIISNTTEPIQKLVVNDEELEPVSIEENKYQVTVKTPDKYGITKYNLTQVIYNENEKLDVTDVTTTVDVLRNVEPTVNDISVNDKGEKPTLTFSVLDPEETFISGKIQVKETKQEIEFTDLQNLNFELNDIDEAQEYNIEIFLTYDFDSDKNETTHQTINKSVAQRTFSILREYNFNLTDYKVRSVNKDKNTVTLQFKATLNGNAKGQYFVDTVKINGTTYEDVAREGEDIYTVEIPYNGEERQEFVLEEAILNNLRNFLFEDKKAVIFKKVTAAIIPNVTDDISQIIVTINMADIDEIAKNIKLQLIDNDGNVETREITKDTTQEIFDLQTKMSGKYTLRIIADYDAEDGEGTLTEREVSSTEVTVPIRAIIDEDETPRYVEKGKEFEVVYTIRTNTKSKIQTVVINDVPCEVVKQEDNKYTVEVTAPKEVGDKELKVTRINFEEDGTTKVEYTSQTEVLKSEKPTIKNVKVEDSQEEGKAVLYYDLEDVEDTFINGKIIIRDTEKQTTQELKIDKQEQSSYMHELNNIRPFTKYDITFELNYDFDKDKNSKENQHTETITGNQFEVIEDYKFKLENFNLERVNRETQQIELSFESSNASEDNDEHEDYYVQEVTVNDTSYTVTKGQKNAETGLTKYTFNIPYTDETRKDLILQKAKLNNLKEFEGFEKHVVVFKKHPESNLTAEINQDQTSIKGITNIKDNDSTLISLEAKLVNPKGDSISTKSIDTTATEVEFTSPETPKMFKAGEYEIQLFAEYNSEDGQGIVKEQIGSAKIKVATKAKMLTAEVANYYVEKDGKVEVKYTFESNNDIEPTGINYNNVYYELSKQDDGKFLAAIPADSSSYGEKSLSVGIAMYNGETVNLDNTQEVYYYVLKDKPSIEYTFNQYTQNQTLEFSLKNPDNSKIENAEVVLEKDGKETRKPLNTEIAKGAETADTTIDLSELEDGTYTVRLSGTYDRTEKGDTKNELSEIFEEKTITINSTREGSIKITNVDVQNKQVEITFESTNTLNLDVKKIKVKGQEIDVTSLGGNTYSAIISIDNEENQTITIDELIMKYEIHIKLNENNSFEIFKQAPTVTKISAESKEDGLHVHYTLTDTAGIATNIKAKINGIEKPIEDKALQEAVFENIKDAGNYTIQFVADYDAEDGREHIAEVIGEQTYELPVSAKISAVATQKEFAEKNEEITITYIIEKNTTEPVTSITIEGIGECQVENGNQIKVNVGENSGTRTFKVTSIKIGETPIETSNEEASVTVLKTKPQVSNYKLDRDNKEITFDLSDPDNSISNGKVLIKPKNEEIVCQTYQELHNGTNKIKLENYEYKDTEVYRLLLDGTYNLLNGDKQLSEIFSEEFQLKINTKLEFENFTTHYPEREKPVDITFKVTDTNTDIPISQIYVNDKPYQVTDAGESKYKITYTAKDSQGIEDLSVDKVKHADNEVSIPEITDKLDILKKKPKVSESNYKIEENPQDKTITFKINLEDDEDAILKEGENLKAYASFAGKLDTEGRNSVPLNKGQNTVTFKDVEDMFFGAFTVTADYDLDTNTLEDENVNRETNVNLITINAGMILPEKLEIKDIQAETKGRYINKNEEFNLSFTAQSVMGSVGGKQDSYYPISAMINGSYYELEQQGNVYTTKTPLPSYPDAGEQQITIESITLNNLETINTKEHAQGTVEVLKDKLSVSKFEINTKNEEQKVTATVEISDSDDSFVNGKLVITDTSTENPEAQNEVTINKNKTEYDLPVKAFKKYEVKLLITTDLDLDPSPNSDHYEADKQFGDTQQVELITDYNLKVSDFKVIEVTKEPKVARLQFKATTVSNHKIAFAKVDDEEYSGVGEAGEPDTYTFEYTYQNEERKEIQLKKVKLDNGTELDIKEELKAVIFKNHPTAEFTKIEPQENMKVHAEFNVTDTDRTLTNLYATLKDESGTEKQEIQLATDAKEATFEGITEPGNYQVAIKADYEALDGDSHDKEELKTSDEKATITPNAKITNGILSTKYPEKSALIDITYTILANVPETPTKVTINNGEEKELISTGVPNEYKISYTAPSVAGVQDIEVTKIHYGDNLVVELPEEERCELKIDVLKDAPSYTVTSQDLLAQKSVIFQIDVTDEEDTIINGTANVHDENAELKKGNNIIPVKDIELDTAHTLNINIEYDRDSNELPEAPGENANVLTLSESRQFTLVSDYGVTVNNLKVIKKDTGEVATYVNKAEPIELRFNSTNKTDLVPSKIKLNDIQNEESDGNLYNVKQVEGKQNEYSVDLVANSNYGKQRFEITAVELSSTTMIDKGKITFDGGTPEITVLKEKPKMENYNSTNNENSVTVTFNIIDVDNAMLDDSKIKIIDDGNNHEVYSEALSRNENSHTFSNLEAGKKYRIEVENKYRLSEDGENEYTETFKSEIIEITKKEEPNFKVKHLEISKRVPKGQKVQITFENAVMSYKDVDHVTIDDQTYEVKKGTDGVYRLEIEPTDKAGVNVIQVKTAQIEGQSFPINRPLSYTNEFAEPIGTPTKDEIEEDGGKAKISYKLKDEDNSIRKLTLYMKATSGAVVAKTDIEKENYVADDQTENHAEISLLKLTRYKLELKATCDIGDGKTLEEKTLFEQEKYSPSYVAILENTINKEQEYVEKGEEVEITFKISTNVDGDAKKIYINDDQYNVEKVLDDKKKVIPDTYKIKVEAPKKSGVFEQKVTAVEVGSELITDKQEQGGVTYSSDIENNKVAIKVLKDTPTVSHFTVDEHNKKVTFKVNDADEAWLDKTSSRVVVKKIDGEREEEVGETEIQKRDADYNADEYNGSDYELSFDTLNMNPSNYPDKYKVDIHSTYDRRPDAQAEKVSLLQRIVNFFTGNKSEVQTIDTEEPLPTPDEGTEGPEESPSPEPEEEPIKEEKIFTQNIELTGETIDYKIQFRDYATWYMFNLKTPTKVQFECSTGTKYKVQKVIFEGKEYPVTIYRSAEENGGIDIYEFDYIAKDAGQYLVNYNEIILENGVAFNVTESVSCMIIQADPTFNIKTFYEDLNERVVRFGYKFVDDDEKVKDKLRFTLYDSQGTVIGTATPENTEDVVEFKIPDPPTSVYKLKVEGDMYQILGWDYTVPWDAYEGEFKSSVTTSIRSSEIKNPYPKKGETIEIIYNISSTKVVRVDKEDHSNQDKAVGISKLVINGVEYDVETLDPEDYGDEKYRIYYTAKDEDGLESIDVSNIIFTNGEEEQFERHDEIEVLKDEPKVIDFSTENNINESKVTFKFKVTDPDNVIVIDDTDIYAEVNGQKQKVSTENENILTFDIDKMDEIKEFNVKATYDLDGDKLKTEGDKNNYVESPIFTKPFVLTGKYGVTFDEVKKYNSEGTETEYFEKGSDIKLTYKCKTDYPGLYPETVTINGENHPIEKVENEADLYTTTIKATDTAGKQEITFNSVTLNSGNQVPLEKQKVEYEVLKAPVTVENFSYKIGQENNDKIELDIKLKDDDQANSKYEFELQDENGKVIPISQELKTGENKIEFEKTNAGKYFATIYSTYDRDLDNTNFENQANKEKIHYEIITVNTRYIEMKDIVDIELYKYGEYGETERVDTITKQVLDDNIDNCIVKVIMKDIPEFYSKITSYKEENNQLKLTLEYQDGMVFTKDGELKPLEVSLDMKNEEYQYGNSFKSLVERMREHPTEDIVLTKDYDLEDYSTNNDGSAAVISDFTFSAKINGNGHTISNLKKPLFNNLKDATVENLVFKNVSFCGDKQKGSLVVSANNTKISNVHVNEIILIQKNGNPNNTGGIAYKVTNGSVIEKCSVTKLTYRTIYLSQNNAGIVCSLESGSKVENCLVEGDASHLWCNNGGLVAASGNNCEMNNNIVKWPLTSGYAIGQAYGNGNGGIVSNSNGAKMTNTISLSDGNAGVGAIYNTKHSAISKDSSDNYQLDTAILKHNDPGINTISKEQINADFFKNKLHLSEDIWSIPDNASYDNLPKLKGMTNSYIDEGEQPENAQVYIPDYGRVSKLADYREENEIAYSNMYKLMPFYDAKELINDGNKISKDNPLSTKLIKYIVPINKAGKMVTYLTTDTYNSLDEIRIVFEDGSKLKYHIDYDDYYGNVASYMITDLKIGYNFNRYVVNANLPIIQDLVETASRYDFNNDLEPLTPKEDSRLYKEEFNNKIKNQLQDFVINVLINEGYYPTFENDVIENKIKQEFTDTDKLKQMIFTYTYFKHWYNLDMQGVNVADALMFQSNQMFDSRITLDYLASKLLIDETSKPNNIVNFYNNNLAFYTKLSNLGLYLDHIITNLTDYTDGNEWFKENFKGGIYEVVDIGKNDNNLDDTIWDHLKRDWKVQRDILPLLTVPEDSAFVISSPTQVYYGSLRVYIKNPKDPAQIAKFRKDYLDLYMSQIKQFYTFAYDFWGAEQLNKYCDTQYDMRTTYTGRGEQTVYNNPYSTEEPYHKYFIEAIDRWAGTGGGAYANGNEVFWNVIKMLDGGFRVSTHETLHNQDSKIFMGDYGRRGGAEDYAAGFLQQYYRDGWVSPNIFDEEANKENGSQNLHRSSVETDAKLKRFYSNYFRTNDFLDYIEAQAFFTLTDAEKAQLAIQVSYPQNPDNTNDSGGERVGYNLLTEDAVAKMNLKDMDALWDNRIMLRPGTSQYQECGTGGGDTDSLYTIHWYQPHANNSRPDSANFKYLAWQMAGERGYYDGLCAYYSLYYVGRHTDKPTEQTTDLTALKYITNKDSFRDYKLDRYKELAQYYNAEGTMFDTTDILERYKAALKADAANKDRKLSSSTAVKRNIFRQIREKTQDFKINPFTQQETPLEGDKEKTINLSPSMLSLDNEESSTKTENATKKATNNTATNSVNNTVTNTTNNTTANTVNNAVNNTTTNTTKNVTKENTTVVKKDDVEADNKNTTSD